MSREIGTRVRRRRTEWGYTQAEMALASGIDRTKIAKIETGERDVRIEEAMAIARMLDISAEELFRVPNPVRYRLEAETADTRRVDAWFDERIEYSLLVRDLAEARAQQS